jgi:hypothetical protein
MNTLQMACMFKTLYKDKNSDIFGVSYASCGSTISGGGWKGSGQNVVVPLSTMAWFHSCHASSFIKLKQQHISFTRKEDYNG